MGDIHTVIKFGGRILSLACVFALIVLCDVNVWVWFGNNRTQPGLRGEMRNATYPWVDLVYKLWIFLHVALIGGFFIVCWFVL